MGIIPDGLERFGIEVGHVWTLVVAIPVIAGAVAGLRKWYRRVRTARQQRERILAEFAPNGGSTLRDAVDAIGVNVAQTRDLADEALRLARDNTVKMDVVVQVYAGGYFETDENGSVVRFNDAYLQLFGITEDEARAGVPRQLLHPDDVERVAVAYRDARSKRHPFISEYRYRRKHDYRQWRVMRLRSFPQSAEGGSAYVGTLEDLGPSDPAGVPLSLHPEAS